MTAADEGGVGGNAAMMRKSWFKAPASSSKRRGKKPYFRFSPPAGISLTTEVRTSYLQVVPPGQLHWDILSVGWTLVWAGRTLMNLQTVYMDCSTGKGSSFLPRGFALLGAVGGFGLSVLVSILLLSLTMSGAALSTRLMGALRLRGSCSWLGERKGSWMVGYSCSCSRCAVTRHLEQQYDLWDFRVFGWSRARYCHLVVIFDPA